MTATPLHSLEEVRSELWISLAGVLRSYAAAHGLHSGRLAHIEHDAGKIVVRHNEKWLSLARDHANVTWTRENGSMGMMELTDHGTLRNAAGEEAIDMAAEHWTRELMSAELMSTEPIFPEIVQ